MSKIYKVLLFGGNGFLGKEVNCLLKQNDIECHIVSHSTNAGDYKIDISKIEDFECLPLNFFDIVINCATVLPGGGYLDTDYSEKIFKTNVIGTQNICKWISKQSSVKKIINCSTLVVVKKPWPINLCEDVNTYPEGKHVLYCASKLTQELLFNTFVSDKNIVLSHVRFSTLYGKSMNWNGIICNIIDQLNNNKVVKLKNASKVSADFLYISDAAWIIYELIKTDFNGIINGASGIETTILKLAETISSNYNEEVYIKNEEIENSAIDRAVINIDKLKRIIEVNKFVSLEEGIKKIFS